MRAMRRVRRNPQQRDPPALESRRIDPSSLLKGWFTWPTAVTDPKVKPGFGVEKYGVRFLWSDKHMKGKDLLPMRFEGDADADSLLESKHVARAGDVLQVLPRAYMRQYGKTAPDWVDFARISRGQRVFLRYMLPGFVSLFYVSLVAGFSAPALVKVLNSTGYLSRGPETRTMRRLMETALMVAACMLPGEMAPGKGEGWRACTRVRFLHARVRRRLATKAKSWLGGKYGVAINQEDMVVTLLAFSYNVLSGIEAFLNRPLQSRDASDFVHLWRYIGFLLGIREEHNPCTSVSRCKSTLESILMHVLEPDGTSRALVQRVLGCSPGTPGTSRSEMFRFLVGDSLGDALELPRASAIVYAWAWFHFQSVRLYTFACSLPVLGDFLLWLHTRMLRNFVHKFADFKFSHPPVPIRQDTGSKTQDSDQDEMLACPGMGVSRAKEKTVQPKLKIGTALHVLNIVAIVVALVVASLFLSFVRRKVFGPS